MQLYRNANYKELRLYVSVLFQQDQDFTNTPLPKKKTCHSPSIASKTILKAKNQQQTELVLTTKNVKTNSEKESATRKCMQLYTCTK